MVFSDQPPLKCVVEILVYEDHETQPVGCVVPPGFQIPLDGVHVKVGVLHGLQGGRHEALQAQEEVGWFVLPDLEKDLTRARRPSIHSSSKYSLHRSVLNLAPM